MKETGTITKINQTGQYPTKDRDTKQPITMKIYSIDFKHLQNTTYYNPHDLKVQVEILLNLNIIKLIKKYQQ